jgi:ribokinase
MDVAVIGSCVVDLCFYVESLPKPGQTVASYSFEQGLGGKGFNQAVAAQRSGSQVYFTGCVGADGESIDRAGEDFVRELGKQGLRYDIYGSPTSPTGSASITIDKDGNNSIAVSLGANLDLVTPLNVNSMPKSALESLKGSKVVLAQLETDLVNLIDVFRQYSEEVPFRVSILNPAPAPAPLEMGLFLNLLEFVDILTPNETELSAIMHMLNLSDSPTWEECKQRLEDEKIRNQLFAELGIPYVVITVGSAGQYLLTRSDNSIKKFPAYAVTAIDTTGAGDAFNGGFATGLARYGDIVEAIRYGSAVSALSVTRRGTSKSLPTEEEVLEFIRKGADGT